MIIWISIFLFYNSIVIYNSKLEILLFFLGVFGRPVVGWSLRHQFFEVLHHSFLANPLLCYNLFIGLILIRQLVRKSLARLIIDYLHPGLPLVGPPCLVRHRVRTLIIVIQEPDFFLLRYFLGGFSFNNLWVLVYCGICRSIHGSCCGAGELHVLLAHWLEFLGWREQFSHLTSR